MSLKLSTVKFPIYMDYHATTPVDPRVIDAMLPYFNEKFGNAASRNHAFGWTAEEAVNVGRERVAALIGAKNPKEIVFTSGATESNNLALKGAAEFYKDKGNHIITTVIEHKAVLDTCKRLEKEGFVVTYLPVGEPDLRLDCEMVSAELARTTLGRHHLFAFPAQSNFSGVQHPLRYLAQAQAFVHGCLAQFCKCNFFA